MSARKEQTVKYVPLLTGIIIIFPVLTGYSHV